MIDRGVSGRPPAPDGEDRPPLTTRLLGAVGAAVIAVTLFGVRIWARVTRTPYYRD